MGINLKLNSLYICVKDMNRAIDFYEKLLESSVQKRDEVFSIFNIDGFRFCLFNNSKVNEDVIWGDNCLLSFEVNDTEGNNIEVYSKINSKLVDGGNKMKPKVAFICVHNSCRSQMAEALGRLFEADIFESYSAGTETKPQINQDAVRIIKEMYGVDMNEVHTSKLLTDIPSVDIVVKMGCNVVCPFLPAKHTEDWGLEDPTGKSDEEFIKVAKTIEIKVKDLANRIENKEICN